MPPLDEITIPSTPKGRQEAEDVVMRNVSEAGFSEEAQWSIKLAMEEAVVNAIKHGNRFDRTKKVRIQYGLSGSTFTIRVRDEGSGFDPERVPDPTAPENISLPHGRGIMLMHAYMDQVEYSADGREVIMVKENR